ncbi:2945_t:CDS:2 [Acaulospora morrowiae]|uniref:2945_t:CDS:1 n=1 Tax=Acaulospora morrowiae TaxID=94023 RepID=A0A9N9ATZ7_9GLOM|nr:2945_t:CDS:2 [Acaulospora morrowiae]
MALTPSNNNKALVLQTPSVETTIKPKQEVLDEDTYTEALSGIIKRDFFPSLLTLEAQHDYVDALGTNNPDLIIEATRKLNGLTTPTMKTPVTSGSRGDWDTPVSNVFKVPAPKKYNENLSLDAFQAKYTSEDNASYP